MRKISDILAKRQLSDIGKYITREYQDYGLRLSQSLGDAEHKALYIKLAKTKPRQLLEAALNFVKDANQVKSKARLFMWKLKQLELNQSHRQ